MSTNEHSEYLPQRRGGRVRGAEGYHKEDISALLKCVKAVLPTTTKEWEQVLDEYRQMHAIPNTRAQRDTSSLKSKYKQLARSFKSGVDARPDVEEAGAILDLIEAKMTDGKILQRRGGRARGAEGFSSADSQAILSIVRRFLPVQRSDWEQVAEEYCREYAEPNERLNRDGSSLKNKFRNWLKEDTTNMPRAEVTEALAIQEEIDARLKKVAKDYASLEHDKEEIASRIAEAVEDKSGSDSEINGVEEVSGQEKATSSEGGDKTPIAAPRRGGRTLGSEGYSPSDTKALLSCVKEILPSGPTGWEQVLQLYRVNHAIPNTRSQRNATGIKIKFRQLVNWKQESEKPASDIVLEARAIQREIDMQGSQGKRSYPESGSYASYTHKPEVNPSESREERRRLLPRTDENHGRQNVAADAAAWSSPAEPVVKRRKQDTSAILQLDADVRNEIASRELELLRQREQREAEQAAWEKERTACEKQRMDMEAWTFVCDRLRALYREQAAEKTPEIVSEIEEEIAVLKKKKQRLANLME
ncbi:hypothetical protein F442_06669 [Phytophthora nicotianae P10297]|uniref:Uncharacterized protein n=5 Tax=Phytophthora nicotianae TaxID=4792 RepID=W2REN3_PHYN3|nr:hypothetical protein PPTG_02727 [Phytophthora nicotianae INRA-310]ETI49572.1 hypothetical protein F443_06628 [Phytophthora nicotianae P1569]ETN23000.1 hypothetical protein PPTG_02727 [Phytophthora nicotianae INRA-310]ETO78287.1 hypothetical protein F444_06699 [Phytophthora nicotianae P1976]ETP47273.1 hypothetical protein F442_06669 [Phytophthora nicotianae P10297]